MDMDFIFGIEHNEGHLWDVHYTDAHGQHQVARYYGETEYDAKRLFRSEQEQGEVLDYIEKVDDDE